MARILLFRSGDAIAKDIFGRHEAAILSPLNDSAETLFLNGLFWSNLCVLLRSDRGVRVH